MVNFANATTVENGQLHTVAQAGAEPVTLYNRVGQALAQPSALSTDGAGFSVSRTSASSTSSSGLSSRRRFIP